MNKLLEVSELQKSFPLKTNFFGKTTQVIKAVDRVSFTIAPGETLGLVGESGCGKTTLGRCILRLLEPSSGRIEFNNRIITGISQRELRQYRPQMQIVFQDPYSSLNPRMTIADIIGEGLMEHGLVKNNRQKEEAVVELLEKVGLSTQILHRYPHEFSGGQRQRIAIARAIALNPLFMVCDEAVSALDVSIQAQIINLFIKLRQEYNLAYLFITHDLAVVKHLSHRIAVMYLGQIVELGPTAALFQNPIHPYTNLLLESIPLPDPKVRKERKAVLKGEFESLPVKEATGCKFAPRCPKVMAICREQEPPLKSLNQEHFVKCFQ